MKTLNQKLPKVKANKNENPESTSNRKDHLSALLRKSPWAKGSKPLAKLISKDQRPPCNKFQKFSQKKTFLEYKN
jgi:hypothetical protein